MTEEQVFSQLQVLFSLVIQNYNRESWCVLLDADTKSAKDWPSLSKVQILLRKAFATDRVARLEVLATVLPIVRPDGKPLEMESIKSLTRAEVYAIISWLEGNGGATATLQTVAKNRVAWGQRIRDQLGWLARPYIYTPPNEGLPLFEGVL